MVTAVAAALVGAMVGGLAGMRFHRKVDKAGLDHRQIIFHHPPHGHRPPRSTRTP